jgi:hypothetical protein
MQNKLSAATNVAFHKANLLLTKYTHQDKFSKRPQSITLRPTTYLLILVKHMTVLTEHGYMLQCKSSSSLIN